MQNVLQALQKFLEKILELKIFNAIDMKNFLESTFKKEGYRERDLSHEILIVHDAGIGDLVNLSPSLRAIRKIFPDNRITFICPLGLRSLVQTCPYIDSVFYTDYTLDSCDDFVDLYKGQMNFSQKLLPFKFDIAICLCRNINGILLAYMSGAKEIVHYGGTALCDSQVMPLAVVIDLVNRSIPIQSERLHIADRYLVLIEGFSGAPIEDRSLEIWFAPRCMKIAREILNEHDFLDKKIFAIVMGGSDLRKHYPPEKYAQLIEKISEEIPDARFILLGGENDLKESNVLTDLFNYDRRIANLVNNLSFAETAAILSMCSMYIGNDTGMMHIAAAVETPCLVPICFPADHDVTPNSVLQMYSPIGVPSVFILPPKSLPECYEMENRFFGCKLNYPHCITQIEVETMISGFCLLLKMIYADERRCNWIF